jgi:hypothetical protein
MIDGKMYIGQTVGTLKKRWREHKNSGKLILRYKNNDPTLDPNNVFLNKIKNNVLYNAMAEHGIENFDIEIVEENADESELNELEIYYITLYCSLVPNGYNAASGGRAKFHHSETSIQLMKEKKHGNVNNTRHPIIHDMPPYVTYSKDNKKGYEWVMIQNHPLCKEKTFTVERYGSVENAKAALLEFLNALEATGTPYIQEKKGNLQKYPGLKETPKGYKIEKYIDRQCYHAGFESQQFTREENRARAIEYYETNIRPLIKCSSTTKC